MSNLINMLHILLGAGLVATGVLAHAAYVYLTRGKALSPRATDAFEDFEWRQVTKASSKPAVTRRAPIAPVVVAASDPAVREAKTAPQRPVSRQRIRVVELDASEVPARKPQRNVAPSPDHTPAPAESPMAIAMAKEVASALVNIGFPKARAQQAVADCAMADRLTIESWTVAALQRARAC